jgi:transcriptional regulator with XRE-family HTH domain
MARGDRRTRRLLLRLGDELRTARNSAGLTLARVADAAGISVSELSRIERGLAPWVDLTTLQRIGAVVGLDVWMRTYPGGEPLRDIAHLRLTDALRELLGPGLVLRGEVPIGDRRDLRAWDLTLTDRASRVCGTELETRLVDAQAQMRRITLKQADSGVDRVLVVVSDSGANRTAIRAASPLLASAFVIDDRSAVEALVRGELPPRDALILVKVPPPGTAERPLPSHGSRRQH